VVLLRHVLEHLPAWLMEQALAEALRVARSAVVIAFYLPPVSRGQRQTREVGDHFLETQWTVDDLIRPITAAGWMVRERTVVAGTPSETDVVWILAPEGSACPTMVETPAEALKVSIIMPTYRRPHTILRTVATIQAQTYDYWELIVVDNAGDGDYRFTDPRIRLYRYTDRPSASAARNYGLQYATGDLVCFFDDDDEMFPHYLARFVAAFAANPRANLVRCGMMVGEGGVNFSFATPECCLRRQFAAPAWTDHPAHDQQYFRNIAVANHWSEARGDIVVIPEVLCRANTDPLGGLRAGAL
jgi:hypothetical protein